MGGRQFANLIDLILSACLYHLDDLEKTTKEKLGHKTEIFQLERKSSLKKCPLHQNVSSSTGTLPLELTLDLLTIHGIELTELQEFETVRCAQNCEYFNMNME